MAKSTESGCSKSGQFNPMLLSTPYGMVWHGVVWYGMVWYCGWTVWHSTPRYTGCIKKRSRSFKYKFKKIQT